MNHLLKLLFSISMGLCVLSTHAMADKNDLEEILKRASVSPELQALDAASIRTVTDERIIKETVANYSQLMARVSGQPELQIQSQLMESIAKQGINMGLMAPMLATYDQMSALGSRSADLVSPLIARMNPDMGNILNRNHGSMIDLPGGDFGGLLQDNDDVFELMDKPMGQLADEGHRGTTFLSGVRPVDMYSRNANPAGDVNHGSSNSSEEEPRGPNTREIISGTVLGVVAGAAAGGSLPGPTIIKGVGAVLGAITGGIYGYEQIMRQKREANDPLQPSSGNDNEPNNLPSSSSNGDDGSENEEPSVPSNSDPESPDDSTCDGSCPDSEGMGIDPTVDDGSGSGGAPRTGKPDSGDSTPNGEAGDSRSSGPVKPIEGIRGDLDPPSEDLSDMRDGGRVTVNPNTGHTDPGPMGGM